MMVTQMVGDREVEKINSSDENLVMGRENEEEAYQKVKAEFGTEPVKIIHRMKAMKFQKMEFEKEIQTAELFYTYNDDAVIYLINASYAETSLGIDVDDEILKTEEKYINGCKMEIKEYLVYGKEDKKYSAHFKYNGLEYCLVATMTDSDFELILNNLFFP